jgi:hypothetical protein
MFIKELKLYLDYLKTKIDETNTSLNKKQEKYLLNFSKNLNEGIDYYKGLFNDLKDKFEDTKTNILNELDDYKNYLDSLQLEIENLLTNKFTIA